MNALNEKESIRWTNEKMSTCHEKKRFTSNQLQKFVTVLKKNEMRYMKTKTFDRKSDQRISFLLSSNLSRHQKREISSQLSKQSKHQNENQSKQQSEQQRQQTKRQHQQTKFQQFQMQSTEQHQSFAISFWTFLISPKSSVFRTSKSHDRVLFNLIKMYSDEAKYNNENDSWNFKFIIFHDMCVRAEMSETIKLMTFSIMFKNFALNYYYSNVSIRKSTLNFVQTCVLINDYFESAEYKRNVLIKWNVIILRSIIIISKHQGKSMYKCLQLLIKEFRHLQHDLNEEFRFDKFIHNKLITVCQNVSACQYVCFKSFDTLTGLINDLQSFIIIFSKSHSHETENYQQPMAAYYTDRRYRSRRQPPRSQSKSSSDESRTLYDRGEDNLDRTMISYNAGKKRCYICNKTDCWSINHIWKERNASKTRLKKRFNESFNRFNHQSEKNWEKRIFQYIIEYVIDHEDINLDAELIDEMRAYIMEIDVSKAQVAVNQQLFYEIN